jgi:CRP-like cAMP-binding protein
VELFEKHLLEKAKVLQPHLSELLALCHVKTFSKHEIVLHAGDVCNHAFFVESGLLRMYSIDLKGKEHVLQFAPENWFISERSSLFFNEKSEYFIDAIEDSTVVCLNRDFFENAQMISQEYNNYHSVLLQKHIRQLQRRVNSLIGALADERYLNFMYKHPDLLQRAPQWMIASYLGITPEGLSRVRKNLR